MLRSDLKGKPLAMVQEVKERTGPWSYTTSPLIKQMAREDFKFTKLYEPPSKAKRTDKMKYRLYVVHDMGKATEEWTMLSCYRHLHSVYKRITKARMHAMLQRMHRNNLRTPTWVIEFLSPKEDTGKRLIRMFSLIPDVPLDIPYAYLTAINYKQDVLKKDKQHKGKAKKRKAPPKERPWMLPPWRTDARV